MSGAGRVVSVWAIINVFQLITAQFFALEPGMLLLEMLFLAGFSTPLILWKQREDSNRPVSNRIRYGFVAAAVLVLVLGHSRISYHAIQFGAGFSDFLILLLLVASAWMAGRFPSKPSWPDYSAVAVLFVAAGISGRREWMLLAVIATGVSAWDFFRQRKAVLISGAVVFVFLASPAVVAVRTAQSPEYTWRDVSSADFFKKAMEMPRRISQSKITSATIYRSTDRTGHPGIKTFLAEQATVLVPRFMNPEKPSFRPGERIYTTFINPDNPRRYSYPASVAGEAWWYFGRVAFLTVPLIGFIWSFLVLFWAERLPAVAGIPLAVVALNTETHLFFLLSTQVRFVVIASVVYVTVILWRKRTS
jgi:hypothetical protein